MIQGAELFIPMNTGHTCTFCFISPISSFRCVGSNSATANTYFDKRQADIHLEYLPVNNDKMPISDAAADVVVDDDDDSDDTLQYARWFADALP